MSIRSIEVILKAEFRLLINLVETWTRQGDRIEVRDSHNNLKEERRRVGDRIEVRDGSGNLIREESGDFD